MSFFHCPLSNSFCFSSPPSFPWRGSERVRRDDELALLPPPISTIFHPRRRVSVPPPRRRVAAAIELSWHCWSGSSACSPTLPTPAGRGRPPSLGEREGQGRAGERTSSRAMYVCQLRPPPRPATPICFSFSIVFSRLLLMARHQLHLASSSAASPAAIANERRERERDREERFLADNAAAATKEV